MFATLTLTDVVAVCGLGFGLAGFVLSVLNFWRDNPRVCVELYWDLSAKPGTHYEPNIRYGVVSVANVGRRPIYVSHAALKLPKGYGESHLILVEGIAGKKLQEGDEPARFKIDQNGMEKYAADWRKIRAQISDSTGKAYFSKRPAKSNIPSWARQ